MGANRPRQVSRHEDGRRLRTPRADESESQTGATNLPNNRSGHQFDREVRRLRWAFSKRDSTLTDDEHSKLFAMFELYPEIGVAWLLKEEFASIYDAGDRDEADRKLQVWKHHVTASGIGEFLRTWQRSLGAWEEQILNYFDDRVTNAFAEGITNKVKVIKRCAYRFRNPVRYRSRSYWLVVIDGSPRPTTVLRVEPGFASEKDKEQNRSAIQARGSWEPPPRLKYVVAARSALSKLPEATVSAKPRLPR